MPLPCCLAVIVAVVGVVVSALSSLFFSQSIASSITHNVTEPHILEMLELSAKGSGAKCDKLAEAMRSGMQAGDLPQWSKPCSVVAQTLFLTKAEPIGRRATEFIKAHGSPEAAIDEYMANYNAPAGKVAEAALGMIPVVGSAAKPLRELYKEIRRAGFVAAAYGHDVRSHETQLKLLHVLYESRIGRVPQAGGYKVGKKVTKIVVKDLAKRLVKDMPGWKGVALGAAFDAVAGQAKGVFVEEDATVRLARERFGP